MKGAASMEYLISLMNAVGILVVVPALCIAVKSLCRRKIAEKGCRIV